MSFAGTMHTMSPGQRLCVYVGIAGMTLLPKSAFDLVAGEIGSHKANATSAQHASSEQQATKGMTDIGADAVLIALGLSVFLRRNGKVRENENAA